MPTNLPQPWHFICFPFYTRMPLICSHQTMYILQVHWHTPSMGLGSTPHTALSFILRDDRKRKWKAVQYTQRAFLDEQFVEYCKSQQKHDALLIWFYEGFPESVTWWGDLGIQKLMGSILVLQQGQDFSLSVILFQSFLLSCSQTGDKELYRSISAVVSKEEDWLNSLSPGQLIGCWS